MRRSALIRVLHRLWRGIVRIGSLIVFALLVIFAALLSLLLPHWPANEKRRRFGRSQRVPSPPALAAAQEAWRAANSTRPQPARETPAASDPAPMSPPVAGQLALLDDEPHG